MIQFQNKKHLSRLVVALVDFQKAQSLFMIAINIAALVVTHKGGLDPQSIDQLAYTYIFTEVVALGGFLPVTFTLFTLHLLDMCSWYLLILSGVSVALSTATLVTIGYFNPGKATLDDLGFYASTGGPPSCNSWRPGAYCSYLGGQTDFSLGWESYSICGFCIFVLVLLMIKQSSKITKSPLAQHCSSWTSNRLAPCLPVLTVPARCIHRAIYSIRRRLTYTAGLVEPFDHDTDYAIVIKKVFRAALYILFTGLYIFGLYFFCDSLALFAQAGLLSKSWSFGQVLAIMVWAQPLLEYLHLEFSKFLITELHPRWSTLLIDHETKLSIGGMKGGMDHRIMPPYKLIKDDENIIVVGRNSDNDTQPEYHSLNERKRPSGNVTPADGYPFDQKTGYNQIDSSEITPVQQESTWPASDT